MDEAIWVAVAAFVVFTAFAFYKLGHAKGFEAGEDHALPPRGPKGRFTKEP
tara:strand:- start:1110 stop:1262 length:153 start_codon:yes stop_codon:yes gene_type:complete